MTDQADIFARSLAGKSWKTDQLQGSMQTGLDFDPEAYAHAMKLAAQHKVEPAAVLDDPKHYERANTINSALSLVDTHPKTAQWLGMPDHVAIGQDDIPNLKKMEEHFTGSTTGLSQSQWKAVLNERARVTQENFNKSEGGSLLANTNAAMSSIPALGYRVLGLALAYPEAGFKAFGDLLWNYQNENLPALVHKIAGEYRNAGGAGTFAGGLSSVGDKALATIEQSKKVGPAQMLVDPETGHPFKNPDYSAWLGRDTLNTVESAPGQLATFMAGGNYTPVLMALESAHSKQRAAVQEMQAQHPETPLSLEEETKALGEGWSSGLLNYAVMGMMPQPVRVQSVGGAVAQGAGRAALLGTGLTAFENLISKLHDPERDMMQGWQQGLVGMGLWEGLGTYHQIAQVRENMQMLDGLEDLSKSSKLNARMREKFEEVIKANADGTGNEYVRVPAEAFTSYFQSVGEDPSSVAAVLEVPNFQEAVMSGGDLRIPVEKWTTRIANTHHAESLIQDVRFQPDQPTIRELKDAAEQAKQIKETAVPEPSELEKFEAKRKAQLEAAGYKPDVADAQAKLHAEVFRTLGESEGLTADQMDQMFHLDITGYRGETKKGVLDVALDRLKEFGHGAKEYFQSVFHGSPYRFDKFSLEHMGKGEGAQAYGYGLYFAGDREVAEYYRETLSNRDQATGYADAHLNAQVQVKRANGDAEWAAEIIRDQMSNWGKQEWNYQQLERTLKFIESGDYKKPLPNKGQLYQVDIPDDGSYLLWDKPLSEQPEAVKKAIWEAIGKDVEARPSPMEHGKTDLIVNGQWNGYAPDGIEGMGGDFLYRLVGRLKGSDEAASKSLHSLGIAGIKYEDGQSRGADGEKSYNYVVFDDNAVKILQTYYQRGRYASSKEKLSARMRRMSLSSQKSMDKHRTLLHESEEAEFAAFDAAVKEIQGGDILSDKRGFTQVLPGNRFHIGLLAGRDLSTFLHESAHYFLEVMGDLAERPEASERIRTMWGDTLKTMGVEARDQIKTEHHEQFAKQFERYLMEGKAPSEATKGIFQRFKAWMKIVYRQLDRIGVRLNDDVRSVFDRLIASDDEIEKRRSKVPDLFATPEDMGETPEVFRIYTEAKAAHLAETHDRVESETIRDLQRERSAEFKAEEETVKREVATGIDSRPDIKALAVLDDPNNEIKLNRKEVEEQFGTSEGIPTVEVGGMDADSAAEILGFESGTKLMKALRDAPDRDALVDETARQIMIDRYGDMLLDGTAAEKAIDALENDKRAEVLNLELKALRQLQRVADKVGRAKDRQAQAEQRSADAEIPGVNSVRLAAAAFIADTSLRNMNAHEHRLASEKYSQMAFDLKGKKEYGEAADAKQKELLHHFLYLEARKALEEGKKIRRMAREGFKKDFQSMLGLAGKSFQDAYNEILRGYEFDNISGVKLDERRAALADLQRLHEADGIDFDPALLDKSPRNYREVPMSELRAVSDALKNIETVARAQREIDVAGQKVAFDHIRALFMVQTPDSEKTKLHRENDKLTAGERVATWARGFDAALLKVEWMADRFDRGDINGPMRTFILNLINDANGKKLELGANIHGRIKALVEARSREDIKRELRQTGIQFPSQTTEMTHQQLITWALNLGTAENRNVALNGEGLVNGDGSLSPLVEQALSKLTESDCRFIQGIWDTLEVLRPLISEKERRVKGIEPKWKETTPFQINTADGKSVQMRGGYFPLAADRNTTDIGRNQGDPLALMGAGSWSRVKVAEGFTKQVTGATYHLRLDYPAVLSEHLNDVITNVTCGEAVAAVNKIITNPEIRTAMAEKLGPEYVNTLKPWLSDFVERAQDAPKPDWLGGFIQRFRSGFVVAKLAGNIPSLVGQVSDVFKPVFAPGVSNLELMKAYTSMVRHPKELIEFIKEKSPNEMRHREEGFNREIRDVLTSRDLFDTSRHLAATFLMEGFRAMDAAVTYPAWLSVYRKGLDTHGNEAQAIREADRVIARTFQAGDPRNMSATFRNRNIWARLFTTFMNDGNTWYGIISSSVASKDVPRISAALMGAFVSQAVFQMLKNRGPGDKKDEKEWLLEQAILTPAGSLPFLGDAISMALMGNGKGDAFSGAMGQSFGAALKPLMREDMDPSEIMMSELDAFGTWGGIPGTSQVLRSWKYLHKVQAGEERPETASEATINTIFGKNPND